MPNRKKPFDKKWSLHPNLHDNVSRLLLLQDDNDLVYTFHNADDETTCIKSYDTNITGRFICRYSNCSSPGWSSKVIPVTIRLYNGQRYNARVYHQRCSKCQKLSRPILDEDVYAERVSYRIQKWAGVVGLVAPPYREKERRGPHHEDLCEGCKAGHCIWKGLGLSMSTLSISNI